MEIQDRGNLTPEEVLTAERKLAQDGLAGKHLVPTKTCRVCGKSAVVSDGTLELQAGRGVSGTAVVPEITRCRNPTCGHVATRAYPELQRHVGARWLFGRAVVELVDGQSYVLAAVPQEITPKMRLRMEAWLAETA